MKKSLFIIISVACCLTANAAVPERKMLEKGKTWYYTYHHFEENESGYDESTWFAAYQLNGDTIIDGRQYMKLNRWDEHNYNKKYYGALREDEEGRVYMYDKNEEKDTMVLDFSLHYDKGYFPDVVRISDTIKVNNQLFP